jgi:uncharacterized membrane protein
MLRLRALGEAFRNSLFFLPSLFVVASVALWRAMLSLDAAVDREGLPEFVRFSENTAGPLLATIAGATITVAGIVFSVTVVSVQLASSQFSPRVLRGFLRDRFQQVVMGLLVGTFTYAMLALGSSASPIPHLTVAVAVALALVALLAILASIDHTARNMVVGEIVRRISDETLETVRRELPLAGGSSPGEADGEADGESDGEVQEAPSALPSLVVPAPETGWVQQLDAGGIRRALPPGGTARIEVRVGRFVVAGTPLVSVWTGGGVLDAGHVLEAVDESFAIGRSRTMQQDAAFGIRQLADIAMRALSPAINDPTTACEVVVHLGAVLREVLRRQGVVRVERDNEGRLLLRPHELELDGYVERALGQIRGCARDHPAVHVAILGVLTMLRREVLDAGLGERVDILRRQAALVVEESQRSCRLPHELARVLNAAVPVLGRAMGAGEA